MHAVKKDHPLVRTLRYAAPNLVTAGSIIFAVLALQATLRGEIMWGAWWALYSTLTDKLDGLVARLLRASSPIGVQLDSLADLLNYGMVPATITYAFFHKNPLGWDTPCRHALLCTICSLYVLCAALRLARFNVSSSNPRFFFGIPSTMSGAIVLSVLVTLCKYGDPAWTRVVIRGRQVQESFPGPRLLGSADLSTLMPYYPIVLLLFGWAMISGWRVPKLGMTGNRAVNVYVLVNLIVGYGAGILHSLPEYLAFGGAQYLLLAMIYHFFGSPRERPEPLFPSAA